jgi:hypothetical protein
MLVMPKRDTAPALLKPQTGKRGVVVPINTKLRREKTRQQSGTGPLVTQARLAEGLQLHLEEIRVARALREFRMQMELDLAAGSEIEAGDLLFDHDLKIVRRKAPAATAGH